MLSKVEHISTLNVYLILNKILLNAQKKGKKTLASFNHPLKTLFLQILRRRYIDTMERARVRANQRKRSQIEQNNSFLQNVGWFFFFTKLMGNIGGMHYKEIQSDIHTIEIFGTIQKLQSISILNLGPW